MSIYVRRINKLTEWKELRKKVNSLSNNKTFRDNVLHKHIDGIFALTIGLEEKEYTQLIKNAEEVIDIDSGNYGYLNCYNDIIATIKEDCLIYGYRIKKTSEKSIDEHIKVALKYAKNIIKETKKNKEEYILLFKL